MIWKRFIKNVTGEFKEELTFRRVAIVPRKPKGTNLWGYYVCEFIQTYTSERRAEDINLQMCDLREKLNLEARFRLKRWALVPVI
jgi:hypothetical protein